jgi:hypothetical protein
LFLFFLNLFFFFFFGNFFSGEAEDAEIGVDCKTYIEKRLNFLEKSEGNLTSAPNKPAF